MRSVFCIALFALGLSQLAFAAPNCPNRPAGAVTMMETPFNTSDGEGQLWELYPGAGKVVQVSGAPGSPSSAIASILPAGAGVGGQQTIWPKPGNQQPLNNLYLCMVWKMNPEFIGLTGNNKLVFLAAQDFTYGRKIVNGLLSVPKRGNYGSGSFQMVFGHNTGGLDNSHACAMDSGLVCYPNVNDTPIYRDVWYTVEAFVVSSTCMTCRNGTVKWWIDGKLQGNYTNLNYGDGIINQMQINHAWDGSIGLQCGLPTNPSNPIGRDCRNDQIHYFDHMILASVGGLTPPPASPGPAPVPAPAPVPVPVPAPMPSLGTVSDLAVVSSTSSSVNLSFTEVSDDSGAPVKYDLRVGAPGSQWGAMNSISTGSCATPIAGSQVGSKKTCVISGLLPSTQYQFQIVAFSGVMNQGASYGGLSSVISVTTQAGSPSPTPAPMPGPAPAPAPVPNPGSGDLLAPQAAFIFPTNGVSISGSVLLLAQAADNVGVTELRFYLNGVQTGPELKLAPYSLILDTTKIQDGNHELSIVAKDAAGNVSAPSKIRINVANSGVDLGSNSAIDVASCMQTKTNQVQATMSLIWLLPIFGLMRRRKKG